MSASQKAGDKTPTAESYRQLQEQNRQLRRILEITRILNTTLNLDTLLNTIIAMARDITATEAASILLLEPSSGELHFKAATGAKEAEVKSLVVPLGGVLPAGLSPTIAPSSSTRRVKTIATTSRLTISSTSAPVPFWASP